MSSLLRLPVVIERTGLSRASVYLHKNRGLLPAPVKIGVSSAWPDYEIAAINAARIAGKSDDEIRELVTNLERQRTVAAS